MHHATHARFYTYTPVGATLAKVVENCVDREERVFFFINISETSLRDVHGWLW